MAVEVVDEEPDVDRLEFSMLFFRGEAGVGTLGGGSIHSMQTARIKKRAWTMNRRNVPLGVSRVGVALTEDASLELENAPLLLRRISQCGAFPTLPSPVGRANG